MEGSGIEGGGTMGVEKSGGWANDAGISGLGDQEHGGWGSG